MKLTRLAVFFFLIFSLDGMAQQLGRVTSGLDVGVGSKKDLWVPSITYHQELSLNNFSWFRIGWGIRGASVFAGQTDLTPKNSALSGDTLKFGKITSTSLSFLVGANVRLWRFDIGANTDLFGLSFGAKRGGLYDQNRLPFNEESEKYNNYIPGSPVVLNAVPLVLDNQNGQSEIYVRYWIADQIGIKLGYVHGRVTYSTDVKLANDQTRFSTTYGIPYVAIAFPLYN
ncbi:hypothetical protein [Dyadobacter luteus]|uniref:hypothetical protein n=1 Tax=Dyadobacter luteus TaxID=2259619 RepID=UPI001E291183|nr:hypothetical protein [Dyadobacter luteus]